MDSSLDHPGAAVDALVARWATLKAEAPGIRPRDAAQRLNVSEAELVATRCGRDACRLVGPFELLLRELPAMGSVMALTRNEAAVHEKVGEIDDVVVERGMGLVANEDLDLRIFFDRWHLAFALVEETRRGVRRSLQFFDADGTAVHKIHVRAADRAGAFNDLVKKYTHPNQDAFQQVQIGTAALPDRPDGGVDLQELEHRWSALRGVDDFGTMLADLEVGRLQALRMIGKRYAHRVGSQGFRHALEAAALADLPVTVVVPNPGAVQTHIGLVRNLKTFGPWFNVLDRSFSLHLREDLIASAWVVRKPSRNGILTSLEIFDEKDRQIAWMCDARAQGSPESGNWRDLLRSLDESMEINK